MQIKAKYLTQDRRLTFEIEGETQKAVFTQIAAIQEVFDSEHKCGLCGGSDIRYMHRVTTTKGSKKCDYLHFVCRTKDERGHTCNARFDFGQSMEGGALFPKRKNEDGTWKQNGGWEKYTINSQQQDREPSNSPDQDPWS